MLERKIIQNFDQAALVYDKAAMMQAEVARRLVAWATFPKTPTDVLDIGAGTGFVSAEVKKRWPQVKITALDSAQNMLLQARRKMPDLRLIKDDASQANMEERFDVMFSSMLLHWLPEPGTVLQYWRSWLKPEGRFYVSLLVDGSFEEWRHLCAVEGLEDGLWLMPPKDFAQGFAARTEASIVPVTYPSAKEFILNLKRIGASTPHTAHKPWSASAMRRILNLAPKPFTISHHVLYIESP